MSLQSPSKRRCDYFPKSNPQSQEICGCGKARQSGSRQCKEEIRGKNWPTARGIEPVVTHIPCQVVYMPCRWMSVDVERKAQAFTTTQNSSELMVSPQRICTLNSGRWSEEMLISSTGGTTDRRGCSESWWNMPVDMSTQTVHTRLR